MDADADTAQGAAQVSAAQVIRATVAEIRPHDEAARARAKARLDALTMPHWALGRLMDLAMDLVGMTGQMPPSVAKRAVFTLAGDHGVVAEGVSKFPQEVTPQMVFNFVAGGAGINALANQSRCDVVVVDMGVAADLSKLAADGKIVSKRIAAGTANFAKGPAMSREQAERAVAAGIELVREQGAGYDVIGLGEMGIGNTTPSAAILCAMTGCDVEVATGRGTMIDDATLAKKKQVIRDAVAMHRANASDGLDVLSKLGGFEIGGIAGCILGAAAARKPVVIDGFICTAGALIAHAICPGCADYMIASHSSMEPGHRLMLERLDKQPLLNLGFRLGEGTGAAVAMNLLEAAVHVLTDVATFEEAAVSTSGG